MKIRAVQNFAADRIKKSLGQLRLSVICEQANIVQLDFAPDVVRQVFFIIFIFQTLHALFDAMLIKGDTIFGFDLRFFPAELLKMLLRGTTGLPEQPIVLVKAIQYAACNIKSDLRRQQFRKSDLRRRHD